MANNIFRYDYKYQNEILILQSEIKQVYKGVFDNGDVAKHWYCYLTKYFIVDRVRNKKNADAALITRQIGSNEREIPRTAFHRPRAHYLIRWNCRSLAVFLTGTSHEPKKQSTFNFRRGCHRELAWSRFFFSSLFYVSISKIDTVGARSEFPSRRNCGYKWCRRFRHTQATSLTCSLFRWAVCREFKKID